MSLASTSSPTSIDASPASIRSSVVLPAPLRPDSVIRSRRSSLNEMPRSSGSPAMSLPRSDAITTAMTMSDGMQPGVRPGTVVSIDWHGATPPGHRFLRSRCRRRGRSSRPGRGELFLRDTGGRRPGRDAAARLGGERRSQLVRRLRRADGRRLPRAGDRPPRPRPRPASARAVPADRLRRRRRRRARACSTPRRRSSSDTRWAARSPS